MARQEIAIGNETFEADVEMISLLHELNNVGLRTTQHCIGHDGEGDEMAYLSIAIQPDMDIGIRYDERPRLIIRWNRSASHNTPMATALWKELKRRQSNGLVPLRVDWVAVTEKRLNAAVAALRHR